MQNIIVKNHCQWGKPINSKKETILFLLFFLMGVITLNSTPKASAVQRDNFRVDDTEEKLESPNMDQLKKAFLHELNENIQKADPELSREYEFNLGQKGHFGHENDPSFLEFELIAQSRTNSDVWPIVSFSGFSPLVARFDRKNKRFERVHLFDFLRILNLDLEYAKNAVSIARDFLARQFIEKPLQTKQKYHLVEVRFVDRSGVAEPVATVIFAPDWADSATVAVLVDLRTKTASYSERGKSK